MIFPARELLQVALGSCLVLAAMILMRDLVSRGRKLRAKARSRPPREALPAVLNVRALETEVE